MLSCDDESARRGADAPLTMKPRLLLPTSGPLAIVTTSSIEPAASRSGSDGTTNETVDVDDDAPSAQRATPVRSATA